MLYNKQRGGFPSLNIAGASDMLASTYMGAAPVPQAADQEFQIAPMKDPAMPPAIKPKAWGKGGKAWKILGIIGDALQTAGGGRATYMPAMLDLQEKVDAERKWQAQLDQQMQIAQMRLAKGPNPTQLQLNYEYARQQDPSITFAKFMAMYHPQFISGPDGQYQVNPGGGEAPDGLTPMTPEEVQQMGLGDGPNMPQQAPSGAQAPAPAMISRSQLGALQQALGGAQQMNAYLKKYNITVGD